METLFLALADETRLRLLNLMRAHEVNVNSFVEILGETQPKISRHLAFLRKAGVVDLRRDGKRIYYKIAKPKSDFAALAIRNALDWMNSQSEMQRESGNLPMNDGIPDEEETADKAISANISAETNIKENNNSQLEIHLL